MFAIWHGVLVSGVQLGPRKRRHKKYVGFGGLVFRGDIVRTFKENRVDLIAAYELQDVHGCRRRRRDLLQFLIFDHDGLVLTGFVTLYDVGPVNELVFLSAVPDFFDPRQIFLVQHVKLHPFRPRGRKEPHGEGNESETDKSFPDGRRHAQLLFWSPRSPRPFGATVLALLRRSAVSDLPTLTWSSVTCPCWSRRA